MSARLFIRNDDVWTLDGEFLFFFEQAMERELPVVHAVIPGKMDQKLVRFLCRAKEKKPHLLDIVQHGWLHTDHAVDTGSKYEFGPSRDYVSQRMDIKQGLKEMRLAFGKYFTHAFVPPYHGYDERTLRIIQEEDFRIFSAGSRSSNVKKRFIDIPAQVSFSRYTKKQKSLNKAKDVLALLAASMGSQPLTGVLTHHADFAGAAERTELTRFFDRIAAFRDNEGWRMLLFSELIRVSRRKNVPCPTGA